MPTHPLSHVTLEQYLAIDRVSEVRHEYIDGQMFALRGGDREAVSVTRIDTRPMSSQPVTYLTVEQYLEIERKAAFRSEYINGEMFAMAGATRNHGKIAAHTLTKLIEQLSGRPCDATGSDTRVYSVQYGVLTYADIVVTCGPDKLPDSQRDTLTDATVIVEVLSPSTKTYDRGEKFRGFRKFRIYRSLPSFSEYLVLAQDEMLAEHWTRQADGSWVFREFTRPADEIELKSIGCRLQLQSLYERVEFEPSTLTNP